MKSCLICLTDGHAGDAETCPHCGEATWSASGSAPSVPAKQAKKAHGKRAASEPGEGASS